MTQNLHSGVLEAVYLTWNTEFEEAEKVLKPLADQNPRFALEYAYIAFIQNILTGSSASRELSIEAMTVSFSFSFFFLLNFFFSESD